MESMNRANIFLANCYINAEVNSAIKVDAERSQVFDKWAEYYLSQEANKTTLNDFEILADPKANEKREVNIKFLKQALLQIISSNVAFKLQIWSEDVSVDSGARNSLIGVFDIVSLMTGGIGDYHLTMYQSDKKPGKKIEIEYYRYRESSGMSTLFGQSVINTYGKSNKGFLSDIKEKIRGIFSSGWKEQKKREKVENLSKYYDGCEMEAYQQSGQVMYVNGFKIINNLNVDEECIEFLQKKFKEQVESSKYYDEFFLQAKSKEEREAIERGLHNPDSIEYRNAYINWYLEGIGDDGHTTGKEYKKIYEMGKE